MSSGTLINAIDSLTNTTYTLSNLPKGCYYYPDRRKLLVCFPAVKEDSVVLFPTHMLTSNSKYIFGWWRVCDDDVRVENDEVATSVDALVKDYLKVVITMNKMLYDKKNNSPEEIRKRDWGFIQEVILFAAPPMMLLVALAITAIVLVLYYPIW